MVCHLGQVRYHISDPCNPLCLESLKDDTKRGHSGGGDLN